MGVSFLLGLSAVSSAFFDLLSWPSANCNGSFFRNASCLWLPEIKVVGKLMGFRCFQCSISWQRAAKGVRDALQPAMMRRKQQP
jgi:hypothetical protein